MRTPEGKPVIGQIDGSSLGAIVGPHGVVLGLPLAISHRERLALIEQFQGQQLEEIVPGANIEPEIPSVDRDTWMSVKGLGAVVFERGAKRFDESKPPLHIRVAECEPKPKPPTKLVVVEDSNGNTVYDKTTWEPITKTVPQDLVNDRQVPYAKHAGATIDRKARQKAVEALRRDSANYKTNRQRHW